MKRNLLLTILISLMSFSLNVNAANDFAKKSEDITKYNSFMTQYNKGIQKKSISGTGTVTLYGYSDCDNSGCSYKYSNTSSDYKEVLRSSVTCTGGEKYIIYQPSGGADGYKENNSENYTGEVAWTEDFSVTCTTTSSSGAIETSNTTTGGTNTGGTNTGASSSGSSSSGSSSSGTSNTGSSSSGNGYSSSTTTENPKQGVETYYIVLGIVGLITYVLMRVVKKQNLFKNV